MKKEIIYSSHLIFRMKIREIGEDLPKRIYEKSDERYFDTKTGYSVAIDEAFYKDKLREMAVAYEEAVNEVRIITIHPIKPYEKINKIKSGEIILIQCLHQ